MNPGSAEPVSDERRSGNFLLMWFGAPVDVRMMERLVQEFKEVREDERQRAEK